MLKPEEIALQFTGLGMAPDEAETYVQLWRIGPSKAADLAEALHFSRPRTYRALDLLTHNGFVTLGAGRPRLYAAAPPATLFRALRDRAESIAIGLQKAEVELVPELERMGGQPTPHGRAIGFTLVRGMDALINQAHSLYAEAKDRIDLLFTHQGGRELFRAVDENSLLAKRVRQGVQVRLLVRSAPEVVTAWATSGELPNVDIRVVDTDVISTFVLGDRRETLVVVAADPAARLKPDLAVAFRTDAPEFVAMQELLFERLWETAEPMVAGEAGAAKRLRSGNGKKAR